MNKEGAVERALIFHQSGPGSTPFVAKLKEGIYNDACRVYETSLGICKKVAIKVSFQRFYHQYEVPKSVMLTSTNRNKVSLIKVLHHYFYISLVDVKNETDRILHSYTPLARLSPFSSAHNSLPISFQTPDTQATDSVALITPLTSQIKSLIFTRLMGVNDRNKMFIQL